jgi:hypothetical protein
MVLSGGVGGKRVKEEIDIGEMSVNEVVILWVVALDWVSLYFVDRCYVSQHNENTKI